MSEALGPYEVAVLDAGFRRDSFSYLGATRVVYRGGEGPPILLLSELPGITPQTLGLAKRLMAAGYSLLLPQLFGEPGAAPQAKYAVPALGRICVSHEFSMFAQRKTSPISEWLRALARHEHARVGGPGLGVIGMCLTGSFALAMMVDKAVIAPVMSQPSLPVAFTKQGKRSLAVSDQDLERIKERCKTEDLCVMGLRFSHDPLVPGERFERLREELGERFVGIEIDSRKGNPYGFGPTSHCVLTNEYSDEPGHPTRAALEKVLSLFARTLKPHVATRSLST